MSSITRMIAAAVVLAAAGALTTAEPAGALRPALSANQWVTLDKAALRRSDAPLIYEPRLKRFMVLGGSISYRDYPKAHPFDELALDLGRGEWENWIPAGKDWGPAFGRCTAPGWKTGYWRMADTEGTCRPNLIVNAGGYGVGYANQYAYAQDLQRTYFYARGTTFCYDAKARSWQDLKPADHPEKALGGRLFWGAMCYVPHTRKVLLFGGGNVNTDRGDPGTWLYDPTANSWQQLRLDKQPPQRAYASMVYDPLSRKVVLFGGDQLHQLISDTWTFDGQKWEEMKPAVSPAPRAGHALVWMPRATKVLLLGGFGYGSGTGYYPRMYVKRPLDAWVYDTATNTWAFVASWAKGAPPSYNTRWIAPFPLRAAADAADLVAVLSGGATWLCQVDASRPDAEKTAGLGVKPGSVERRTGCYDPAWYGEKAGAGDPAAVEAELAGLAPNTWTLRPSPNRARIDVCWGTAAFSPDRDQILRFSGGHCVYSGTAPQVYDVRTDRWSIPFAPEMPLDFCASNGLVPGEWSFSGSPWMMGHTYNATGYEPRSKSLILVKSGYTYFFDPAKGRWSRAEKPNPFRTHVHVTTMCVTGKGVVAWIGRPGYRNSLHLLDGETREWARLPLIGRLPRASADAHGMCYDPKRNRLLLMSSVDADHKGDVLAYDMKTGEAKWLGAAGKAKAAVPARETVYLPDFDAVLVGYHVTGDDGKKRWPIYDCQKNAWFAAEFGGADPLVKTKHYSVAVMYDAKRNLLWAVDNVNRVYALRLEAKTLLLRPLQ